jgi:hypothetical protein
MRTILEKSPVCRSGLVVGMAIAALIVSSTFGGNAVEAATDIAAPGDLPAAVSSVYERLCTADSWVDGRRKLDGSTTSTFADGTRVYLMVCGDAAATVPFAVIVMSASGDAAEAKFRWMLKGRDVGEGAMGNAAFGSASGTVVSYSHSSASCNPEYAHRWTGEVFELVRLNRSGCQRDE